MDFRITIDDWELDLFPIPPGIKLESVFGSSRKKWTIKWNGDYMATACFHETGTWSLRFHGRETRFRRIPNLHRAIIYAVANHGEMKKRKG